MVAVGLIIGAFCLPILVARAKNLTEGPWPNSRRFYVAMLLLLSLDMCGLVYVPTARHGVSA